MSAAIPPTRSLSSNLNRQFFRTELREIMWYWISAAVLFGGLWLFVEMHLGQPSTGFQDTAVTISTIIAYAFISAVATFIFTGEFTNNTMPRLLAQPISRAAIWNRKMSLLALSLATFAALQIGFVALIDHPDPPFPSAPRFVSEVLLCTCLFAFCTSPLLAVLLRQGLTALLASMIAPFAIFTIGALLNFTWQYFFLFYLTDRRFDVHGVPVFVCLYFAAWCAFAYWLGRRTFLRLEV